MNYLHDPTTGTWQGVLITEPGGVAYVKVLDTGSYSVSHLYWQAFEGQATILHLNEPPVPGVMYTPAHPKLQMKMWGTWGYLSAGLAPEADGGAYLVNYDDGVYEDGHFYVAVQAIKGKRASVGLQVSFQSS